MKRRTFWIAMAFGGFLVLGGTSAMVSEALDGERLAKQRCAQCHDFGRVKSAIGKKDQAAWQVTVDRMIGKRAGLLNSEERAAVLDYLVK